MLSSEGVSHEATITNNTKIMNITSGRKVVTTAGTRVKLVAAPAVAQGAPTFAKKLIITPLHTNTGTIAIGDASVLATAGSEQGIICIKDCNPIILEDIDVSQVYIDATVNGEGVGFAYEF